MFNVKQYSHQNGLNGSGVFIVNFEHISHIVFLIISIFLNFFLMRENIVTRNG